MQRRYVIIGASAAGVSAAEKLRRLDPDAAIICITEELDLPYNKCFLADYLSGLKDLAGLHIKKETFFEEQNIVLKQGCKIVSLNPQDKEVKSENGEIICYDKLLLAVGGSVTFPPIPGLTKENGALSFYTLKDTETILNRVKQPNVKKVLIIGAGLSGLECADSIVDCVDTVTVVEKESHVLYHQITEAGASVIQDKMRSAGIDLLTGTTVQKVYAGVVTLSNGSELETDLIICALGARPNGWLAENAGLKVENGAIVTDDFLNTTDPDIFATGDVALVTDKLSGKKIKSSSWPDAIQQGMIAASKMAGLEKKYGGTVTVISSAFFGAKFFVCGNVKEPKTSYNILLRKEPESFRLILLEKRVVKGFLLIGQTHHLSLLKRSLLTGQPLVD